MVVESPLLEEDDEKDDPLLDEELPDDDPLAEDEVIPEESELDGLSDDDISRLKITF